MLILKAGPNPELSISSISGWLSQYKLPVFRPSEKPGVCGVEGTMAPGSWIQVFHAAQQNILYTSSMPLPPSM